MATRKIGVLPDPLRLDETRLGNVSKEERALQDLGTQLTYTDPTRQLQVQLNFLGSTYFKALGEPLDPKRVYTYRGKYNIWVEVKRGDLQSISKTFKGNLLLDHPEFAGAFFGREVYDLVEEQFHEKIAIRKRCSLRPYDFVKFCIEQGFMDTVMRLLYCWHLDVFPEQQHPTGNEVLECKFLQEGQQLREFKTLVGVLKTFKNQSQAKILRDKSFCNFYLLINIFRSHLDLPHVPFQCIALRLAEIDPASRYTRAEVQPYLLNEVVKDEVKDCFRFAAISIAAPLLKWISDPFDLGKIGALSNRISVLESRQMDALWRFVTRFTQADVFESAMKLETAFILSTCRDLFYDTLPTVRNFIQNNISKNPIFLKLLQAWPKDMQKKKQVVPINLTMDSEITKSFNGNQKLLKVNSEFCLGDTEFRIMKIEPLILSKARKRGKVVAKVANLAAQSGVPFEHIVDSEGPRLKRRVDVRLISQDEFALPGKLNIRVPIPTSGSPDEGSIVGSIIKEISIFQCESQSSIVFSMDQQQQEGAISHD